MDIKELKMGDIVRVPAKLYPGIEKNLVAEVEKIYKHHVLLRSKNYLHSISVINCDVSKLDLVSHKASDKIEREFDDVLSELGTS